MVLTFLKKVPKRGRLPWDDTKNELIVLKPESRMWQRFFLFQKLIWRKYYNFSCFFSARLRDQLGTAKNANEMFRIFSRFNALFVRPHIRGAIREYQTQLIQRVKGKNYAFEK